VYGSFQGTATALMIPIQLVDANIDVSDREAGVHLGVLDNTIMLIDYAPDGKQVTVPPLNSGTAFNLISDSQQTSKTFVDVSTRFVVVFIPVSLGARAAGTIGIDYSVDVGREEVPDPANPAGCSISRAAIKGKLEPFASVDGEIYAAIDVVILSAGIKGVINIVHVGIPFTAELSLGPHDGAHLLDLDLTLNLGAALSFVFLSGHISVYVNAGICPLCKSAEAELVAWDGLHYDIPLFSKQATFPLLALQKLAAKQGVK